MTDADEAVYTRSGNFAVFNQFGLKLSFSDETGNDAYYAWLDEMIARIGSLVPGAEIAEKSYARAEPRMNTGVYYDTEDHRLLDAGLVLRTTCNIKTHAFCAFKFPEDDHHVRRDHRYSFEGEEKRTIQSAPTSAESAAIVQRLLAREDIDQPGVHLRRVAGIRGSELSPALCLRQYRHPFFVWLDKRDALRCSMDRVQVHDLRRPGGERHSRSFSEIELPIYPHLDEDLARGPRVPRLIEVLAASLCERFGCTLVAEAKYQRAGQALRLGKYADTPGEGLSFDARTAPLGAGGAGASC